MKKFNKVVLCLITVFVFALVTGCSKEDYTKYSGNKYSGKDPWGNELTITVSDLGGDRLDWIYHSVIGQGEDATIINEELTNVFRSGVVQTYLEGNDECEYHYDVKLTFKDNTITIEYTSGSHTVYGYDGSAIISRVDDLPEESRTVVLTQK